MRLILAACAITLLPAAACRGRGASERAAAGEQLAMIAAAEQDSFAHLAPCVLPPIGDTAHWHRARGRPFLLPADFAVDTTPIEREGGAGWRSETSEVAVMPGHWGWSSFARRGEGTRCRVPFAGRAAMYVRSEVGGRREEALWLPDTATGLSVGSTIYVARSPVGPAPLLARALQTHPAFGR